MRYVHTALEILYAKNTAIFTPEFNLVLSFRIWFGIETAESFTASSTPS